MMYNDIMNEVFAEDNNQNEWYPDEIKINNYVVKTCNDKIRQCSMLNNA